ncbi:MAG: Na+/H+ antiporter subunit E [Devosia sp.]|nr:Na+/H+ antiporter subunit E [Devosia sp.]
MSLALMTIALAIGWAAATDSFSPLNILFGAALAGLALFLVRDKVAGPNLLPRLRRIGSLAWLFTFELFVSATRVALLVARPDMERHLRPAIIAFPLTLTRDAEITTLANLITLTPGTLSVDVSADRRVLYVHAICIADKEALIREIAQGFEAKVMEAFR